jgi:hypothetical protein
MALSRQRLLTMAYGDMETIRMVCNDLHNGSLYTHYLRCSFLTPTLYVPGALGVRSILICLQELEGVARDWVKPPPAAAFSLRVPVEYASLHAAVSRTFVRKVLH